MRRSARLALALAAPLAAAGVADAAPAAPATPNGVIMCGTPSALPGRESLLCDTLVQVKETVGLRLRNTANPVTYRVLFGRAASPDTPLVVLAEIDSANLGTLTVRTLKRGEGAEMPQAQVAMLDATDIRPLLQAADKSKFWSLPAVADASESATVPPAPAPCADSKPMVIEGLDRARYHIAYGNCRPDAGLQTFEHALVGLAKRHFPDVVDPWRVEAAP